MTMELLAVSLIQIVAIVLLTGAVSSMAVISSSTPNIGGNLTLFRLKDRQVNGNIDTQSVINGNCTVIPVYVGHKLPDTMLPATQTPRRYGDSSQNSGCTSVPNYLGEEGGSLPTPISSHRPNPSASSDSKVSGGGSNSQTVSLKNRSRFNSALEPTSGVFNTGKTVWTHGRADPTIRSNSVSLDVEELKKDIETLNRRTGTLSVHVSEMEQTLSRRIDTAVGRHVQTLLDLNGVQKKLQPLGESYRSSLLFNPRNGCPDRYVLFSDKGNSSTSSCFWFSNFVGSWAEAYTYCRMMGSHLATINNRFLRRFVLSEVTKRHGKFYYLGGTDLPKEGTWRWFASKKHFFHRMWRKNEPNNAAEAEHCLAIGPRKKWVDIKCDRRINFICQIGQRSGAKGR